MHSSAWHESNASKHLTLPCFVPHRKLPSLHDIGWSFHANTTVTKYAGLLYTASKYTFSPPERGNIVPNSRNTRRPQKDTRQPRDQQRREEPTLCTEERIEDGVLKIPRPIIFPTLCGRQIYFVRERRTS